MNKFTYNFIKYIYMIHHVVFVQTIKMFFLYLLFKFKSRSISLCMQMLRVCRKKLLIDFAQFLEYWTSGFKPIILIFMISVKSYFEFWYHFIYKDYCKTFLIILKTFLLCDNHFWDAFQHRSRVIPCFGFVTFLQI